MAFSRPENMRCPGFCDGCPSVEGMKDIQISRAGEAKDPLVVKIGPFADTPTRLLVAHDPNNPDIEPAVLGTDYIVDPFCNCHEYPASRILGEANEAVDKCEGAIIKKRLFGLWKVKICGAGIVKASEWRDFDEIAKVTKKDLQKAEPITESVTRTIKQEVL